MINEKTNLKDQIAQIERKLEVAYLTGLAIAGDRHFKDTKWKQYGSWLPPAWYQSSSMEGEQIKETCLPGNWQLCAHYIPCISLLRGYQKDGKYLLVSFALIIVCASCRPMSIGCVVMSTFSTLYSSWWGTHVLNSQWTRSCGYLTTYRITRLEALVYNFSSKKVLN